jgi:uncharacterized protein (DUF885 family)
MRNLSKKYLTISLALLAAGCNQSNESSVSVSESAPVVIATNEAKIEAASETPSAKANQLFDKIFMQQVMRSPIFQSYLGIKDDQDKWDDMSDENAKQELALARDYLKQLDAIDASQLDGQTQVSLKLIKQGMQEQIDDFKWRFHNYPLNQMFGTHSTVASLLINQHQITELKDAEDYIARLNAVKPLFDQVIEGLHIRAEKGIIAPKFVYPYVINDSKNLLKGMPFTEGEESTLLADFNAKLTKLEVDDTEKQRLADEAIQALKLSVKPAYENLITALKVVQDKADDVDGAWKLPDGEAFYNNALARTTTTDMSADQIHQLGLAEVARIHDEMRGIMKQVKFEGDLKSFFEFMRHDPQFYYEESEKGKARYLKEATTLIDNMKLRLDELFIVKPEADLTVRAVEAFREKSAGKAFYQSPSMDGSRPGIYYANLYRMSDMPSYQMEALAYHEGIPGHHMQRAISQELQGIPKFRKFANFTAYTEGWGLYSELLPKEIGLYSDPYSDFGRLAMELWRACRLVVDTGIHSMKWTRQQGIDYYVNNTPNPQPDAVKMVERHIVMPSQATAYKIGMIKIMQLRASAKKALQDKFDIREFHQVVLKNGPVPLNVLQDYVEQYVADKKAQVAAAESL